MAGSGLAVAGFSAVAEGLEQYENNVMDALGAALFERAIGVMAQAKKRAPVATGRLMRSGGVSAPYTDGRGTVAVVLFFGVHYAPVVHETHPTNDQFLEEPFEEARGDFEEQLRKAFSEFIDDPNTGITPLSSPKASGEMMGRAF